MLHTIFVLSCKLAKLQNPPPTKHPSSWCFLKLFRYSTFNFIMSKNLLAPKHICDIFYKQFKNYVVRSNVFPIPRFNTVNYGKHSIRYLGPYLWGKMDKDLRNKTSLHEFKKAVRAINLTDVLDGRCSCYACST